jgi:hypothetical protein
MIKKLKLNAMLAEDGADRSKIEPELQAVVNQLISLANHGHPLACFSYAKEAFENLRDGGYRQTT